MGKMMTFHDFLRLHDCLTELCRWINTYEEKFVLSVPEANGTSSAKFHFLPETLATFLWWMPQLPENLLLRWNPERIAKFREVIPALLSEKPDIKLEPWASIQKDPLDFVEATERLEAGLVIAQTTVGILWQSYDIAVAGGDSDKAGYIARILGGAGVYDWSQDPNAAQFYLGERAKTELSHRPPEIVEEAVRSKIEKMVQRDSILPLAEFLRKISERSFKSFPAWVENHIRDENRKAKRHQVLGPEWVEFISYSHVGNAYNRTAGTGKIQQANLAVSNSNPEDLAEMRELVNLTLQHGEEMLSDLLTNAQQRVALTPGFWTDPVLIVAERAGCSGSTVKRAKSKLMEDSDEAHMARLYVALLELHRQLN